MTENTVISADPQTIAEQCRRYAVRTAVKHLVEDAPHLALLDLIRSIKRCAHLDNRPLDADRVRGRARALAAGWGERDVDLMVTADAQQPTWTGIETEEVAS
jgi:hypothetical protein